MSTEGDFESVQESSRELTKSQINRLGDRLRKGEIQEEDRQLLEDYRLSFTEAYATVVGEIRSRLKLEVTGRPAKTTKSIVEKLRREKTRLSQMQDIAGCRLIVENLEEQDHITNKLVQLFGKTSIVDRRYNSSHGYRALHIIVNHGGKLVEIQVRTLLQDLWAALSERLSDEVDASIKYGGGDKEVMLKLLEISEALRDFENAESRGDLPAMKVELQRYRNGRRQLDQAVRRVRGEL